MSSPKAKRHPVSPSIVKSEIFIFALLVLGLAIYVPLYLSGSPNNVKNVSASTNGATGPGVQQPTSPVTPIALQPGGTGAPTSAQPAPVTYLLPYILSLARIVINFLFRIPKLGYSLIRSTVLRPLSYPLSFLLAVFRPLTLLLEILYILFLRTPYVIISWIVREAIYPLYVFVGVAVLLGGSVGLFLAQLPKGLMHALYNVQSQNQESPQKAISSRASTAGSNRSVSAGDDISDVKVEASGVSGIWRSRTLASRSWR